jgi:hypothetical protein
MYLQFHKHPFYCDIQTIYENAILSGNGEAYLPWQGDVTQIFLGSNTPHLQPTSGWLLSHHRFRFQRTKPPKTIQKHTTHTIPLPWKNSARERVRTHESARESRYTCLLSTVRRPLNHATTSLSRLPCVNRLNHPFSPIVHRTDKFIQFIRYFKASV